MKCLLITDGLMLKSNRHPGQWYTKNTFVEFTKALAVHFSSLTLFVPVKTIKTDQIPEGYFKITANERFKIAAAGDFASVAQFYLKAPAQLFKSRKRLFRLLEDHDVALLRLPSMNALYLWKTIIKSKTLFLTYVVGDQEAIVSDAGKYKGMLKTVGQYLARHHSQKIRLLTEKSAASVFLGSRLQKKYGQNCSNPFKMFTSLVKKQDIHPKAFNHWPPRQPKLLFAGRLEHEKGL
ncbi:MAG: hypothetical protein GY729_17395, partial [Desulfobacteraceae bacterium]|nr:hypothetical protein [Desulfobacteraceae bacterium]